MIIATKFRFPMGEGPNEVGLSRKQIRASVEASLRRLGTDSIDLYQTHAWDAMTPLEETLGTLNDLVREGKVRYIGASCPSISIIGRRAKNAVTEGSNSGDCETGARVLAMRTSLGASMRNPNTPLFNK